MADQASKAALLYGLDLKSDPRVIEITAFFNLVMVWNRGVSFGLFQADGGGRWLLIGLSAAILIILILWLRRLERRLPAYAIGLIIGGAVGNVVDRVVYGAVADFFDLHIAGYHWYAFNIADSAIVIGVGLLLADSFIADETGRRGEHAKKEKDAP